MDIAATLIAILLGWILGQASGYMERRDQRRRTIRKILCDLLVARDALEWALYYTRNLAAKMPFPVEERGPMIAEIISKIHVIAPEVQLRYNAALESLAEYNPITAYHLHSKASVESFVTAMRDIYSGANTPDFLEYAINQSEMIENTILQNLNEYILAVAANVGKREHKYIKDLISGGIDPDSGYALQVDYVIKSMSDLAKKSRGHQGNQNESREAVE